MTPADREAVVTFRDAAEPWDLVIDDRMINCHLLDPEMVETPAFRAQSHGPPPAVKLPMRARRREAQA
ncbi:MAG: hypothetical protein LN413_08030 [Candidatus Thermoplasmatota archaeon]|nr:hypothetical protein [Candidatus Thermoplasmatota archaeon]